MKRKFFVCIVMLLFLVGCNFSGISDNLESKDNGTIGYVKAKELIINNGAVMVDVRSSEEYNEKHIDGSLSLPVDSINEESAKNIFNNKNAIIIVYCKSGVRSSEAASKLDNLGYKNVYNLGAMSNWKE